MTPKIVRRWKHWGIGVVLFLLCRSLLFNHGIAVGLVAAVIIVPLGAFLLWFAGVIGVLKIMGGKK